MADNLTLHMAQDRYLLVAEISPVGMDTGVKVIKRSQISSINILDSILFGSISDKDGHFTIIRSDLILVLGNGVNLGCNLSKENLKMLSNIKGNNNALFYYNSQSDYLFTNGNCTALIRKAKQRRFDEILPNFETKFRRQTDKCKQIVNAKGKAKSVDILIYDSQISLVHIPDRKVFMSLNPIATAELIKREPDIKLRSHFFFHLVADEALLEIAFDKGIYWLRTVIQLTQDISIEQFEPLQRIK